MKRVISKIFLLTLFAISLPSYANSYTTAPLSSETKALGESIAQWSGHEFKWTDFESKYSQTHTIKFTLEGTTLTVVNSTVDIDNIKTEVTKEYDATQFAPETFEVRNYKGNPGDMIANPRFTAIAVRYNGDRGNLQKLIRAGVAYSNDEIIASNEDLRKSAKRNDEATGPNLWFRFPPNDPMVAQIAADLKRVAQGEKITGSCLAGDLNEYKKVSIHNNEGKWGPVVKGVDMPSGAIYYKVADLVHGMTLRGGQDIWFGIQVGGTAPAVVKFDVKFTSNAGNVATQNIAARVQRPSKNIVWDGSRWASEPFGTGECISSVSIDNVKLIREGANK